MVDGCALDSCGYLIGDEHLRKADRCAKICELEDVILADQYIVRLDIVVDHVEIVVH